MTLPLDFETPTVDDLLRQLADALRQRDFALGLAVEKEIIARPTEDPNTVAAEALSRFRMAAAKATDSSYYVQVGRDAL